MKHIQCAGAVLYSQTHILLEDRRLKSKHGEQYSFYGGSLEQNETPLQTVTREINEELGVHISEFEFVQSFSFKPKPDLQVTYHMFIAKMPDLNQITTEEGSKIALFEIQDVHNIPLIPNDRIVLDTCLAFLKKYLS